MSAAPSRAAAPRSALRRLLHGALGVFAAIAIATLVMLVVVSAFGYDARKLAPAFVEAAVGNPYRVAATLSLACPLGLLGLAVALSLRGGVLNIGGEGQYLLGAAAAAAVGPHLGEWASIPAVAFVLLAASAAGAAWSALAGWLKIRRGVQEVLSTILLNLIAIRVVEFLVRGPLVDPASIDRDSTAELAPAATLWQLWPQGGLHAGVALMVLAVAAGQAVLSATTFGYRARVLGANPQAAAYAGLAPARITFQLFLLSGAIAGLAGGIEVAGSQRYLTGAFASGYGYTAIAVALLARLTPWGVLPSALFFAAIDTGTRGMQRLGGAQLGDFPTVMRFVGQGTVVLVALALFRLQRARPHE